MVVTQTEQVLALPVVCLETANFELTVSDIVKGKNTVIDFWTTRCTQCPGALDALNEVAIRTKTKSTKDEVSDTASTTVQFVSICCDRLDGAREILQQSATPRWNAMNHFFMEHDDKERAKQLLGFKQVPFYLVFTEQGDMVYSGGKLDLQSSLPAMKKHHVVVECITTTLRGSVPPKEDPVLIIDDMDF